MMKIRERMRAWIREHDLDLLFGSYPYFIPKKLLREKIRRSAREVHGRLVDVGCGYRPYRYLFAGVDTYIGVDADARRRPDIVARVEALPFRDEAADVVLCTEVLEHCPDPFATMREVVRILHPAGVLILTTPMSWNLHYEPHDYFRFTRYGLATILAQAGVRMAAVERVGGVFALTGARLTEVICKSTARALKVLPVPIRLLIVRVLYICMTLCFFTAARLLDWVDKSDAIGWFVIGEKVAPAAAAAPSFVYASGRAALSAQSEPAAAYLHDANRRGVGH
jgi:SAM-dependent methyltransferase